MQYFVGLDIGGTNTKAVLLGSDKKQLAAKTIPTHAKNRKRALKNFISAIKNVSKGKKIRAIGIAIAGAVDEKKGMLVNAPNLRALEKLPIAKAVEKEFNVPALVENDANAAAFAESELGAGKKSKILVLLTLGTGIGSGIILSKKLFTGATHSGAEIGHMIIDKHGYKCACGNRGCFEAMANAAFIKRRAKELSRKRKTILKKFDPFSVQMAAAKGDPVARQTYKEFAENLGIGLANTCNIFNPDLIVLSGGISKAKIIYPTATKKMKQLAFKQNSAHVKVLHSKAGYFAGAIGAALLAMREKN